MNEHGGGRYAPPSLLMLLYNNVAKLRRSREVSCQLNAALLVRPSNLGRSQARSATPIDLDIEVADFLAQGISVDAEQVGRPDLIAACGGQCRSQQRIFDFP